MANTLTYRMAGGLGLEPRLTESESFRYFGKNPGNPSILRIIAQEIREMPTLICGFIRHIIVTVFRVTTVKGCSIASHTADSLAFYCRLQHAFLRYTARTTPISLHACKVIILGLTARKV